MSETSSGPTTSPKVRSTLRSVAMPTEHGGWGLTAEPVLLGLLVAPSVGGLCLGLAAFAAFLARSPLRIVLVDRHRQRDLQRTALARRVLAGEVAVIAVLVLVTFLTATSWSWWWPAVLAAPLVAVELWFDTRSKSRRLAPELTGTLGICSVAAMILLADGHTTRLAIAVWMVLAARAVSSIPHVRAQIERLHRRPWSPRPLLVADAAAVVVAGAAAAVEPTVAAGAVAVACLVLAQRLVSVRLTTAKAIGIEQTIFGLVIVVATAVGIRLA